ncbi:MAG: hypothetical protein HC779_07585 [Phyllobacteriaceae bacterium]|nr:hypothetical protein [Phyllobacteriaceae bacterium]
MHPSLRPNGRAAHWSGLGSVVVEEVAGGADGFVLAEILAAIGEGKPVIHVMADGQHLPLLSDTLRFAAPSVPLLELPAWDCLPYDRVSPGADAASRRLSALTSLAKLQAKPHPAIILTTANAVLQMAPPVSIMADAGVIARAGGILPMSKLIERLERQGFDRVATVREVGEYAVRGGILDLFAPGTENPVRLDFFGDAIESLRAFDAASQLSSGPLKEFTLNPASEVELTPESIARFRKRYIELFGAPQRDDALYAAVSRAVALPAWSIGCRCFMTSWPPCLTMCPKALWCLTNWPIRPLRNATSKFLTIMRRAKSRWWLPAPWANLPIMRWSPTAFICHPTH